MGKLIFISFLSLMIGIPTFGALPTTQCIYAFIEEGALIFPNNTQGYMSLEKVSIPDYSLDNTLTNIGALEVRRIAWKYTNADTTATTPMGSTIRTPQVSRLFGFILEEEEDLEQAVTTLEALASVRFAGLSYTDAGPDTDLFSNQWGLQNTGQTGGTSGADIRAVEAWEHLPTSYGADVLIGVYDTGVWLNHPDLTGIASGDGWDDNDPDRKNHGTQVATVIGAIHEDPASGMKGVDPAALINSHRVYRPGVRLNGTVYDKFNIESWMEAVQDGLIDGELISNHSFSGDPDPYRLFFDIMNSLGHLPVVSAGNDFSYSDPEVIEFPAGNVHGSLTVGATDDNDDIALYSRIGPHVDLVAPGGYDQLAGGVPDYRKILVGKAGPAGSRYTYNRGTSFAAPLVAGSASTLYKYLNYYTGQEPYPDDLMAILKISANDVNGGGDDNVMGSGRLDLNAALRMINNSPTGYMDRLTTTGNVSTQTIHQQVVVEYEGLDRIADIIEVTKIVPRPGYCQVSPYVWGIGIESTGLAQPDYDNIVPMVGYCKAEVLSGGNSIKLMTYVYAMSTITGQYLGYEPCAPVDVEFVYTVMENYEPSAPTLSRSYVNLHPKLTWKGGGEHDLSHYVLWRQYDIIGGGTLNYYDNFDIDELQYLDATITYDKWNPECIARYRVKAVDTEGQSSAWSNTQSTLGDGYTSKGLAQNTVNLPEEFSVGGFYPNPFNPITQCEIALPDYSSLRVSVYNILGEIVYSEHDANRAPGWYTFNWNGLSNTGKTISSGTYIIKFDVMAQGGNDEYKGPSNYSKTQKVMYLR